MYEKAYKDNVFISHKRRISKHYHDAVLPDSLFFRFDSKNNHSIRISGSVADLTFEIKRFFKYRW